MGSGKRSYKNTTLTTQRVQRGYSPPVLGFSMGGSRTNGVDGNNNAFWSELRCGESYGLESPRKAASGNACENPMDWAEGDEDSH